MNDSRICRLCGKPLDKNHDMRYPPIFGYETAHSIVPPYVPPGTPEDQIEHLPSVILWRWQLARHAQKIKANGSL